MNLNHPLKSSVRSFGGFILLLLMISCSFFETKEDYIQDFTSFINDVKASCTNYTNEDWLETDDVYEQFATNKYEKFKAEFTSIDEITIVKLKGTYTALKVRKGTGELFDQAKDIIDQAGDELDSTFETLN
jgi:hypothetical protein